MGKSDAHPEKPSSHKSRDNDNDSASLATGLALALPPPSHDVLSAEAIDPALDARIRLINAAVDEIGMTPYQWKMFLLTGFGYFVANHLLVAHSVIAEQAALELLPHNPTTRSLTVALSVGTMVGTISWGFIADVFGRRWAFNLALVFAGVFSLVSGAAPNWIALAAFVAGGGLGVGGCWTTDATTLVEFIPRKNQWLVILLGLFWGIGHLTTGLFAWAFLPNFSCESAETCTRQNNMGWRYVWFCIGSLVIVLSVLRVTVVRMEETPKYLIAAGKDAEAVGVLQRVAAKYNRTCSLTVEQLAACGERRRTGFVAHAEEKMSLTELWVHVKGLFSSRRIALSSGLVFLSSFLSALGYAMFFFLLPAYLEAKGKSFSSDSAYITWRNYVLTGVCLTAAAPPAVLMANTKLLGRRYTMALFATFTFAMFMGYIYIKTKTQNLVFSCIVSFGIALYTDCLYGYVVEVSCQVTLE